MIMKAIINVNSLGDIFLNFFITFLIHNLLKARRRRKRNRMILDEDFRENNFSLSISDHLNKHCALSALWLCYTTIFFSFTMST